MCDALLEEGTSPSIPRKAPTPSLCVCCLSTHHLLWAELQEEKGGCTLHYVAKSQTTSEGQLNINFTFSITCKVFVLSADIEQLWSYNEI